jgi:type IV secretion system protein VirD4
VQTSQFKTNVVRQTLIAIAAGLAAATLFLWSATFLIASVFAHQPALGPPVFFIADQPIYLPWAVLDWRAQWHEVYPRPFAVADFIVLGGLVAAAGVAMALKRQSTGLQAFGKDAWAGFDDLDAAGLFANAGAILGKFGDEIIAFDGPEHQILIGASRSGKGRGHVVPTLLSWCGSALVLDVKGELADGDARHGFPGTAGHRALLGPVYRFAPTSPDSHGFNPLTNVRKGENEVRDVQNIVDMIVEPQGESRGSEKFWNNSGKNILTGVVLHVLYAEPIERKTLAVVRERLGDLDKTAEEMRTTLHRINSATGRPEVHPEVLHAAQSYLSGEARLRSGIKATAESFFGVFADPIVAAKTAHSDFHIGDLMCGERPVTLYLQPAPSDAQRLMPLMRIFIAQVARSLMESQTHDALGRPKNHRLLLMLDEFPLLGRIDFFEKMMGAMAGYGLKTYLVCQSLNHITRAYGRDNVILDNCHVVTAFSAVDPETAKRIADMAGEVWEVRPQRSEQRPRSLLGQNKGSVTYREERRPLLLPADVRSLPGDSQLIFVSGCKPIKAKKLRFDCEPIFAKRLRPSPPIVHGAAILHDWIDVEPLGRLRGQKQRESILNETPNLPPPTSPPQAPSPLALPSPKQTLRSRQTPRFAKVETKQPDLFAPTADKTKTEDGAKMAKISDPALAGFRGGEEALLDASEPRQDQPRLSSPPSALQGAIESAQRRRVSGTGL